LEENDKLSIRGYGKYKIESVGVDLAKRTLLSSDIVLHIIDITDEEIDTDISSLCGDKPFITVYNKGDLTSENLGDKFIVSAVTGEGIEELKRLVFDKTLGAKIDLNGEYLTEERHFIAIKNASEKLTSAITILKSEPLDMASLDILDAWQALGEISGRCASEEVIDEIFRKFCVGK